MAERSPRQRRHPRRRRRLRRRLRRAAARPGRRDDRQPGELHALHAAPARGGVGHARAAARGRAAAADVPARRARPRPGHRRSTRPPAPSRSRRPTQAPSSSRTTGSWSRSGAVPRTFPVPGLAEHGAAVQGSRRRDPAPQPRAARARGGRRHPDPGSERRHLGFVFVGAGYAGVEALAELSDLVRDALRFFPRLQDAPQRWVLVDAAPKILAEIPSRLGEYAAPRARPARRRDPRLDDARVDRRARGGALGRHPDPDAHPRLDDRRQGPPAPRGVGSAARRAGPRAGRRAAAGRGPRAHVGARRLRRRPERRDAGPNRSADLPARAPPGPPPGQEPPRRLRSRTRYRMLGQVATLGRYKGIADVLGLRIRGFPGWFVTRTYHLFQLPLVSRKLRVVTDWTTSLFFRRDIAELSMLGHAPDWTSNSGVRGRGTREAVRLDHGAPRRRPRAGRG